MNLFGSLLLLLVFYLGAVIFWGVVCLLAYSISLVTRKTSIINAVLAINMVVAQIVGLCVGIYVLFYDIQLLLHGQILWFFVMLFVGGTLVTIVITWIQLPFIFLSSYFATKIEKMEKSNTVRAEIIDKNNKVIGVLESETDINRRLATMFLANYVVNLVYLAFHMSDYPNSGVFDFVVLPVYWLLTMMLGIFIVYSVYLKIRRHKFFYPRKKAFLARVLKTSLIITVVSYAIIIFVKWLYSI